MAKKINKKKAIITTLIWTFFYFAVFAQFAFEQFDVNLLSVSDIKAKYFGFLSGMWSLEGTDALLFLISALLFFPLWIAGACLFYKIKWKLPVFKKHKEKNFKRELLINPNATGHQPKMPAKLRLQNNGNQFSGLMPQQDAAAAQNTPAETVQQAPDIDVSNQTILSQVEKEDALHVQELLDVARTYSPNIFENIVLNDIVIPIAISLNDDDTALLVLPFGEANAVILADTDSLDGDWYTTLQPYPSPASVLKKGQSGLAELEPNANVIPLLVITEGMLSDAETTAAFLQKNGIRVARFKQGKPETLETFEQVMASYFKQDTSDETN